jgi:membrane protease YdiL (CAAX protease family)
MVGLTTYQHLCPAAVLSETFNTREVSILMGFLLDRVNPRHLLSKRAPRNRWQQALQFPLLELAAIGLFILPVALIHNAIVINLLEKLPVPQATYLTFLENIFNVALFLLAYSLFCRLVEGRKSSETAWRGSISETAVGFLGGGLLVAFTVGLIALLGHYRVLEFSDDRSILVTAFFRFGIGSFIQEFFIRLILFRMIEELTGTWSALVLVAAFFGFMHSGNENATLFTSVAVSVSDVLFIAAYLYTRRLWLVWGLHFGWNFLQDGVFGMANSGITELPSWIQPEVTGPAWLTGGTFGIEASAVGIALQVILGVWLLLHARNLGQFMPPYWRRTRLQLVQEL